MEPLFKRPKDPADAEVERLEAMNAVMLTALKETLAFWTATRFAECENGCDCVVDVVRAAIAKAEGH